MKTQIKVPFSTMCEQIEKMPKQELERHLKQLGCTSSYDDIKNALLKTYNELEVADNIFQSDPINAENSAFPIEFIDEAVGQVVKRESFPFVHYGILVEQMDYWMSAKVSNQERIEQLEPLFRSLYKCAKAFHITSLESMMYQVNDGVDVSGIIVSLLDCMMQEGRQDKRYLKQLLAFVDKFLSVFPKTSDFLKVSLLYEQAQAYIAMKSKKGEQMFLQLINTHSDPTDVVLHYALAYIDDNQEKAKRILQKYTPILDPESESYDIIEQIKDDYKRS